VVHVNNKLSHGRPSHLGRTNEIGISHMVNISKCYNKEYNLDNEEMNYILIAPNIKKNVNPIAGKELQVTLKNALKKM
jgi:hypothetical protein